MKRKIFLWILLSGSMGLYNCKKDNDKITVPEIYQKAFTAMYPEAQDIKWEKKGIYYVVDFRRKGTSAESWFDFLGEWQMTITEIPYATFPQAVKKTFKSGEYGNWHVEDTEILERRNTEKLYILEVEKNKEEYKLYFTETGMLVKIIPDTDDDNHLRYIPKQLSPAISNFIVRNYPNAKVIDIDKENRKIEVDILDGAVKRKIVFTPLEEWQYTKTEVRISEIPEAVMQAFEKSKYSGYKVDDIDFYDTPDKDYYIFELENEPEDIRLKIFTDGTIGS